MKIRCKTSAALAACGLLFALAAHAAGEPAAPASAADAAVPADKPKIEYAKVRTQILAGDSIGFIELGWFCNGKTEIKAPDRIEDVLNSFTELAFKKVSRTLGLSLAQREVSAFDTGAPSDADYRLGGTVLSVDNKICTYSNNVKGSIKVEIKWDLFSTKQQRVVLSRTVTASYARDSFETTSPRDFQVNGFAAALTAFFADADVKQALAGVPPAAPVASLPALHLPGGSFVAGSTLQKTDALKAAVVTISSDSGSGSGFYVADGYLLTNRHVVGSSKYVKVKLASGKELVGEVIRENGPRDVALLKTESAGVPAIRLRATDGVVGEDVWAIGSPLGQQLAGTMTRGVLSGVRTNEGLSYLQSDVAVNPGNSGGPLIDAQGNAIGLTALKINGTTGLAFFVPGRDAMDRLSVTIDAAADIAQKAH
jgi:serine protease Do